MTTTLTAEGAVLAVVMMRRPGNRGRLILLIAGAPTDDDGFHYLGVRPAAHYLGTGTGHVHNLLRQLVAGSVVERRAGAGRRPVTASPAASAPGRQPRRERQAFFRKRDLCTSPLTWPALRSIPWRHR